MKKSILVLALATLAFNVVADDSVSINGDRLDPKLLGPKADAQTLRSLRIIDIANFKKVTDKSKIAALNAKRAAILAKKNSKVAVSTQALVLPSSCDIAANYTPYHTESYSVSDGNSTRTATKTVTNLDVTVYYGTAFSYESQNVETTFSVYNPITDAWLTDTYTDTVQSDFYGDATDDFGYSVNAGYSGWEFYADTFVYNNVNGSIGCDMGTTPVVIY